MTDGLEISEVRLSELERTIRFDSEFYRKSFLKENEILKGIPHLSLTDKVKVSDGNHMSISEKFLLNGIPYYRGQDVKSFFIEDSTPICIDEQTFNNTYMKRSHLEYGDILLSIVGTIGSVSLVSTQNKSTCSCKLAILRPNLCDSDIIALFLSSKYGQHQIKRLTRGAVQMGLILEDIDQIVFPVFGDKFKSKVSENIKRVKELKQKSVSEYFSAENLLNDYLGVSDFDENSCAVKSLSDSFKQSGRLDAEYYLPKYDALFETLSKFTTANLGELVSIKKSIEPGSEAYQDEGIPFVRVSDVNKFGISEPSVRLSPAIVSDIESLYPRKNTILLSKDGSIGIAYKVEEDMQVVTSGALLHLTVKDTSQILPDYLTLALNSQIVQLQAERDCNGAIIQHWKPSDIEKVRIPVLDTDKQKEISDKVQESFRLRKEAKRLLEKAIKAVETAIETDEETALKLFAL